MWVVSASRRTDIPALYWPWFKGRLRDRYCHWVNPFNAQQIYRLPLAPEDVAVIDFWTRNARPMLPDLGALAARYAFYVHYTVNGYPHELEPSSPKVDEAVDALCRLSEEVGPDRVIWRYDPIILSSLTPEEYHIEAFAGICERVRGRVGAAYFSFCDPYSRTQKRFSRLHQRLGIVFDPGSQSVRRRLASSLSSLAAAADIPLFSCAEAGLDIEGVKAGHCIDPSLIARMRPDLDFGLKAAPTREACGCVQAVDIGAFDTCVFGCEYCYANKGHDAPLKRRREHAPVDSLLWRPPSLRGVDLTESALVVDQKPMPIKRRESLGQLAMPFDSAGAD